MKPNAFPLFMLVLPYLALASHASAATVNFSTPVAIAADTDVNTSGTTVLAAHAKWNTADNETVNGVTFHAPTNGSTVQPVTQNGVTLTVASAIMNSTNPFIGTKVLSGTDAAAYQRTVSNAWELSGARTLTLTGLTVGHQYLVQFWAADFRQYTNNRSLTIGSVADTVNISGQLPFLGGNGSSSSSGRGTFVIGTFTADSSTQVFPVTVTGVDGSAQINAFQLRDLGIPGVTLNPTFSPVPGTYATNSSTVPVTLTSESGATIYYTMDGNDPTTASASGTSPLVVNISVPSTVTLKAMAAVSGKSNSAIVTGSYTAVPTTATWTNAAGGSWPVTTNWLSNYVPNGSDIIGDFSTLSLTADTHVTLDGSYSLRDLVFDDLNTTPHTWTISGNAAFTESLTLATSSTQPTINTKVNVTLDNTNLQSTAGITKIGAGTLTLSGTNSNIGATNINEGTIQFNGTNSTGILEVKNGSIEMTGGTLASDAFLVNKGGSITVTNGVWDVNCVTNVPSIGSLNETGPTCNYTQTGGSVSLNGIDYNLLYTSNFGNQEGNISFSGGSFTAPEIRLGMRGNSTCDISNGAVVTMTSAFSYGHVINIGSPTARILNLGDGTTFSGGTSILDGGTSGVLATPEVHFLSHAGNATINFNGGTLRATASGATFMQGLTHANVLDAGGIIDTQAYNITLTQSLSHGGTNATDGGLIKKGSGTLTLGGSSSFTGPATVAEGTLNIANSGNLGIDCTVNVTAAGTLSGSGLINGPTTISGTVSPGDTVGRLITSATAFEPGSTYHMEIAYWIGENATNNDWDFLDALQLQFNNTAANQLTIHIVGTPADFTESNKTLQIAAAESDTAITNFDAAAIAIDASGFSGTGTWAIQKNGRFIELAYTAGSGNTYPAWATTHAGGQPADLDYDGDGITNGVEYFMGITTAGFTANPAPINGTITWPMNPNFIGSYAVQTSNDLINWTAATAGVVENPGVSVSYTLPTGDSKRFARIQVDIP